jgi:Flp pilus assembly secretin CpaC
MKTPARFLIASLAILTLARVEAQEIHIKARFIELPGSVAANLYLGSFNAESIYPAPDDLPQPARATLSQPKFMVGVGASTSFTGIMTESQFRVALRTLESTPGVEELAEPEVTTSSGRQTEMRATEIITVITNFVFAENSGAQSNSITPQTTRVETGPILDATTSILPDSYTIDLRTTASRTEFLGYDKTTNTAVAYNKAGEKINLPTISPSFGIRKASAQVKLLDGQTVVLGGLKELFYDGGKEVSAEPDYFLKTKRPGDHPDGGNTELLVFITVTLVDSAGNRIHSDDEMPFAKGAIPPQDDPVSRTQ